MDPQQWLKTRFPVMKVCDKNWTWERYDYPQNVRDWIKNNWTYVSDAGGGTWSEPNYYNEKIRDPNHRWYKPAVPE